MIKDGYVSYDDVYATSQLTSGRQSRNFRTEANIKNELSSIWSKQDWEVSEIGYGMWGMGSCSSGSDDENRSGHFNYAVDLGCNFFDTAWGYGAGHSESLLGRLVRANAEKKLYTATKIPPKNMQWPCVLRDYTGRDFST